MPNDPAGWDALLLNHVPQQWLGIVVLAVFSLYALNKGIQESEALANKFGRFGRWIRARNHRKHPPAIPPDSLREVVSEAIRAAREDWEHEENQALKALERRVGSISTTSKQQAGDIKDLQKLVQAFTAFSVYDARWHHMVSVSHTDVALPGHLDFFEFEPLWRANPHGPWGISPNGSA